MLSVGIAFSKETLSVSCMSAGMAKVENPVQLNDIAAMIRDYAERCGGEMSIRYTVAPDADRAACEMALSAAIKDAERIQRFKFSATRVPFRTAVLIGSGLSGQNKNGYLVLSLEGDRCLLCEFKPENADPVYSYLRAASDGAEMQIVKCMLSVIEANYGVDVGDRTQALVYMSEEVLERSMEKLKSEARRMLSDLTALGRAESDINIIFDKLGGNNNRTIRCVLTAEQAESMYCEHIQAAAKAIGAVGGRYTFIADAGFDRCFWCRKAIERAAVSDRYIASRDYGINQIASKGCVLGADADSNPYIGSGLKYPVGFVAGGRYYEVLAAGSELPASRSVIVSVPAEDRIGFSFVEKLPDLTSRILTEFQFQPDNYRRGAAEVKVSIKADGENVSIVVSQTGTARTMERTVQASDSGNGGMDVVFLVDYSRSVSEEMRREVYRRIGCLVDVAEENVPGVRYATVGCGAGKFVTHSFDDDKCTLQNHVEFPHDIGKSTNMTDAVKNVRNIVAESRKRKVCVVFTDGCFDNPSTAMHQFRNLIEKEGVRLYFVHLGFTPQDIFYRILGSSSQLFRLDCCDELAKMIFDL